MVFSLLLAIPAMAAGAAVENKVNFEVNGDPVIAAQLVNKDGVSMVAANTFARFAGATVEWTSDNTFTITENGTTMSFTVGKKEALLGDKSVTLPVVPVRSGEEVLLPLRFVTNAFGFEVAWDAQQRAISLNREETKDGMTPSELLAKSTLASQKYNTYGMEGNMDINMQVMADGKKVEEAPGKMSMTMSGQIQSQPMQIYMKQNMAVPAATEQMPEMTVETYLTEDKMYMKAPGQEWTVMDMPFGPEFWKQQQDIQSDPLKAAAQMKEMGMLLNFGNDVTVNGKDYYVVNASLDMNKFRQSIDKILQQALAGMPQEAGAVSPEEMQQQIQKFMNNAFIDYYYTILVNKETLISDFVKASMQMNFAMNTSDLPQPEGAAQEDMPKEVKMNMNMQGEFQITDLGKPFAAPDVSKAVDMKELQQNTVEPKE